MDGSQSMPVAPNQVALANDPDHLPPPPPGFQWARLDDVVRRSLTGSETSELYSHPGDRFSQGLGNSSGVSNEKIDRMLKVANNSAANAVMRVNDASAQGLDDYRQPDRYGAQKSLHAGIDASELKYGVRFRSFSNRTVV